MGTAVPFCQGQCDFMLNVFFVFFLFGLNTILFTGRTLTLLTILKLYLHTFTFTLHCSYLHYLYKQNRTSTYTTYNTNIILTFTFTLHCSYLHYYTSTNYNTYNTISNHLIRLQSAYLQFTLDFTMHWLKKRILHKLTAANYPHTLRLYNATVHVLLLFLFIYLLFFKFDNYTTYVHGSTPATVPPTWHLIRKRQKKQKKKTKTRTF